MMEHCKRCNDWSLTGFALNVQGECKECEKDRLDKWVKNHKFIFHERVCISPTDFHPEKRYGIVIEKGEDVYGAWGYYSASEWYKIKMDKTNEIVKFSPEQLEKEAK